MRLRRAYAGSSPRMRGTLVLRSAVCGMGGIIPAYAGNTRFLCFRGGMSWDHPRVCGEHFFRVIAYVVQPGSSPRMRGTHDQRGHGERSRGIIPAYAGNTIRSADASGYHRDHPRVCGEHAAGFRSRGASAGIIPAYAGNTANFFSVRGFPWDHPRVCGEHHFQAPC